jgi:hypothetical protein
MIKDYKGKEICQGCKKSGIEKPRLNKEGLCTDCDALFRAGIASKHYEEIRYCNVFLHCHAYYNQHVSNFAHTLLAALNNPTAKFTGGYKDLSELYGGSNGKRYIINEKLLLPLRQFFKELDSKEYEFQQQIKNMPETVKEAVKEEKTKIYNEGVAKGRDLLFQLNNGQITTEDFEKNLRYSGCPSKH